MSKYKTAYYLLSSSSVPVTVCGSDGWAVDAVFARLFTVAGTTEYFIYLNGLNMQNFQATSCAGVKMKSKWNVTSPMTAADKVRDGFHFQTRQQKHSATAISDSQSQQIKSSCSQRIKSCNNVRTLIWSKVAIDIHLVKAGPPRGRKQRGSKSDGWRVRKDTEWNKNVKCRYSARARE